MMKPGFFLTLILAVLLSKAQLNESFSDGDFTNNAAWSGTVSSWQVVANSDVGVGTNSSNTLRLSVASGSGMEYLATRLNGSWNNQQSWGFWIGRRAQAATSSNVSYVWLYSNEADITSATVDGYRIRFGDDVSSGDRILLESVTDGLATNILASAGAVVNAISDFGFLVRVTRDNNGVWKLYTSSLPVTSGAGATASEFPDATNTNILQGSVTNTDITDLDDGYIVVAAQHSTAAQARAGVEFDQIVFGFTSGSPLPVKFGAVKAIQTQAGISLEWNNLTETDVVSYVIERSLTGENFSELFSLPAKNNNGGEADYQYMDGSLIGSRVYYRIKVKERTGKNSYSQIVWVSIAADAKRVNLFPDPVTGNQVILQVSNVPKGSYAIRIYNNYGQAVGTESLQHAGGSVVRTIFLDHLNHGTYYFELRGQLIFQKRFVVQ